MSALFKWHLHFARAFTSRSFALLWTGQAISNLGDCMFSLALAWQVLLMTHSGTALGLVLLTASIPQLIFVLIGGVAVDRLPKKLILFWSDGGRGLVVLVIAILGFTSHLQFWHLEVEALLFGVVSGFFGPAILSILPDLVAKEDLASANALQSFSRSFARLVGPTLAALFIALSSPMGAFVVNALSFFVSAAFLCFVQVPQRSDEREQRVEASIKRKGIGFVVADIWEGLGYVRSSRWLWVSVLAGSIGSLCLIPPLYVALPLLVSTVYHQGVWLLGLINAADAIGSMLALLVIAQAMKLRRRGLLAYLSLVPTGLGFIILGLPFPLGTAPVIAPLASAMVGFGLAFFSIIWVIILQEMIPREKLGRVLSLDTLAGVAMAPAAQAIGGILTDSLGPAMVCILGGSLSLITVVIPLCVRDIREMP